MSLRGWVAGLDRGAHTENDRLGRLELVGVAFQTDQRLDARVQFESVERLDDEIVGPRLETFEAIVTLRLRGDDDHWHQSSRRLLFETPADIEAVPTWCNEVEQHQVGCPSGAGWNDVVGRADH